MRLNRLYRQEPPWPPGLESIRKAILGPRRHCPIVVPGVPLRPYDDTLLIALALNALLSPDRTRIEPEFQLNLSLFQLRCVLHIKPPASMDLLNWAWVVIGAQSADNDVARLRDCQHIGVRVIGSLEGAPIDQRIALSQSLGNRKAFRFSDRWTAAIQLLQRRHPAGDFFPTQQADRHC